MATSASEPSRKWRSGSRAGAVRSHPPAPSREHGVEAIAVEPDARGLLGQPRAGGADVVGQGHGRCDGSSVGAGTRPQRRPASSTKVAPSPPRGVPAAIPTPTRRKPRSSRIARWGGLCSHRRTIAAALVPPAARPRDRLADRPGARAVEPARPPHAARGRAAAGGDVVEEAAPDHVGGVRLGGLPQAAGGPVGPQPAPAPLAVDDADQGAPARGRRERLRRPGRAARRAPWRRRRGPARRLRAAAPSGDRGARAGGGGPCGPDDGRSAARGVAGRAPRRP